MQKFGLNRYLIIFLLTGCTVKPPTTPAPMTRPHRVWIGPVKEIPGIEPIYEQANAGINPDPSDNFIRNKMVTNIDNFSETGLVTIYDDRLQGQKNRYGVNFDPEGFTAGHATLPIPSYLRVTNLANHRQIVVKVNDRAAYQQGRIISLTSGVANRLNLSDRGRVKIEIIHVDPDNSLSGPGTYGTIVAKQSYDLPDPPTLNISVSPLKGHESH